MANNSTIQTSTPKYNTIDRYDYFDENGNIQSGSRDEDQKQAELDALKGNNPLIREQFNKLEQKNNVLGYGEQFQQDAQKIVNKYADMQGAIYSSAGKQQKLQEELDELAEQYQNQIEDDLQSFQTEHNELMQNINDKLNQREDLSQDEINKLNFEYEEWQGKIKGELYFTQNTREVEDYFNNLARQAEHDPALNRFLQHHYSMFLDSINSMNNMTENERTRAMQTIKKTADNLYLNNESDQQRALKAVRERAKNKRFGSAGAKKNIENIKENIVRQNDSL